MCESLCLHQGFQQVHPSLPRLHFVRQREAAFTGGFCLKALPDHSFMRHFPECTIFTGPHDNRLVGTQGARGGEEERERRLSECIRRGQAQGRGLRHRAASVTGIDVQGTARPPPTTLSYPLSSLCLLPPSRWLMAARAKRNQTLGQARCRMKPIRSRQRRQHGRVS